MISEADEMDYRQQDREERESRRRERIREPNIGEPCETCNGEGSFWQKEEGGSLSGSRTLCPKCLGTRVQP